MASGTELLLGIAGDPRASARSWSSAPAGRRGSWSATSRSGSRRSARARRRRWSRACARFPLLDGFRGRPRADLAAVHDAVLRIGVLAAAHPEVAELDCDPVVAGPGGAVVVDARVRLEPPPGARPYAALGR